MRDDELVLFESASVPYSHHQNVSLGDIRMPVLLIHVRQMDQRESREVPSQWDAMSSFALAGHPEDCMVGSLHVWPAWPLHCKWAFDECKV